MGLVKEPIVEMVKDSVRMYLVSLSLRELMDLVMRQEPCCSAKRVFRAVDNGSSEKLPMPRSRHRGAWPNIKYVTELMCQST